MALRLDCPRCGSRPYTEFWFDSETRPLGQPGDSFEHDFERVWMRPNVAGVQQERWFHYAGCRRHLTVERDTRTNEIRAIA